MFAVDERGFGPTHDSAGALNLFDQFADKKACMTRYPVKRHTLPIMAWTSSWSRFVKVDVKHSVRNHRYKSYV